MFINNPLAMVRDREMRTEALMRDAAADRRAREAQQGRARPVESQPTPTADAVEIDAQASGARPHPAMPRTWELAPGG